MVRIALAGAAGRMGRMVTAAAAGCKDCRITGAFDRSDSPAGGQDVGLLAGVAALGVKVSGDPGALLGEADVLIDFTQPDSTVGHASLCARRKVALVIGTTGLSEAQRGEVAKAAEAVPIVLSPNMSVGVNVTFKIIEEVARILGGQYDIEIVEAHHRLKKDSPSGTAARMLEILARARNLAAAEAGVYGRKGLVGPRPAGEIGVHAVRGGDIVGDHTVLFAGPGERIEITHRSASRANYAQGALRAARFLESRPGGLFDMNDVLGLK
jgi:4-hydroxy-tetrahydrodipicolinate reductase